MRAFIILSRIDSSRMPAKAFLQLGTVSVLESIISQLKCWTDFKIIVATSDREMDNCIANAADKAQCLVYRGDLDNVSKRIVGALEKYNVDAFFRINGDSPTVEPTAIDKAISLYSDQLDFVSNLIHRTFPYGVAVELFRSSFYVREQMEFNLDSHFEHPTSYIYDNIDRYNYQEVVNDTDYSGYSLTIDTLDDYLKYLKLLELDKDFFSRSLKHKVESLKKIA